MKWVTRHHAKVDRIACPWLIRRFIDPEAEFLFVPAEEVATVAARTGATPFDVPGAEFGHHGQECSFDALVHAYRLDVRPALALLARIVNGADTDNTLWHQPESAGLQAVAEGFRHLNFAADLWPRSKPRAWSTMRCMPTARRWCGGERSKGWPEGEMVRSGPTPTAPFKTRHRRSLRGFLRGYPVRRSSRPVPPRAAALGVPPA